MNRLHFIADKTADLSRGITIAKGVGVTAAKFWRIFGCDVENNNCQAGAATSNYDEALRTHASCVRLSVAPGVQWGKQLWRILL